MKSNVCYALFQHGMTSMHVVSNDTVKLFVCHACLHMLWEETTVKLNSGLQG